VRHRQSLEHVISQQKHSNQAHLNRPGSYRTGTLGTEKLHLSLMQAG